MFSCHGRYMIDPDRYINAVLSIHFHDGSHIDFSVVNDMNYYNGIVFRGFVEGVPEGVLSGGQYDKLMEKMNKLI